MRIRPRYRRCGGPLDFDFDFDDQNKHYLKLGCSNEHTKVGPIPIQNDEEFWERFDNLDGDDVVRLGNWYPEIIDNW